MHGLAAALLLLLLASASARADAVPDPEDIDAMVRDRLRAAGQACPDPWRHERLTPEDQAYAVDRHVYAERILCGDGTRYLVSSYARRPRGRPFKHFALRLP